jgi:hypothetical protein
MRRVELPGNLEGRLFLHSMPGRYESLEEFLAEIVLKNISCVVCLAPPEEIRRKSRSFQDHSAGASESVSKPLAERVMSGLGFHRRSRSAYSPGFRPSRRERPEGLAGFRNGLLVDSLQ